MKMRINAALLVYCFLASFLFSDAEAEVESVSEDYLYVRSERDDAFAVSNGLIDISRAYPHLQDVGQIREEMNSTVIGVVNCSDQVHLCIDLVGIVLAVPRGALAKGRKYSIAGANFEVLQCNPNFLSTDLCASALIKSICSKDADTTCVGKRSHSQSVRYTEIRNSYFVYVKEFGVTSFGTSEKELKSRSEVDAIARDFSLQGDLGFLKK